MLEYRDVKMFGAYALPFYSWILIFYNSLKSKFTAISDVLDAWNNYSQIALLNSILSEMMF